MAHLRDFERVTRRSRLCPLSWLGDSDDGDHNAGGDNDNHDDGDVNDKGGDDWEPAAADYDDAKAVRNFYKGAI